MATTASNTTSSSSPQDNEGDVAVGGIIAAAGGSGGGGGGGDVMGVVCPPNIQAILAQCTLGDQDIHSNITIATKEEEQQQQQHSYYYDCSHDSYLASVVPPGKYKNVTSTYLSIPHT